jgi:hypothetical protein
MVNKFLFNMNNKNLMLIAIAVLIIAMLILYIMDNSYSSMKTGYNAISLKEGINNPNFCPATGPNGEPGPSGPACDTCRDWKQLTYIKDNGEEIKYWIAVCKDNRSNRYTLDYSSIYCPDNKYTSLYGKLRCVNQNKDNIETQGFCPFSKNDNVCKTCKNWVLSPGVPGTSTISRYVAHCKKNDGTFPKYWNSELSMELPLRHRLYNIECPSLKFINDDGKLACDETADNRYGNCPKYLGPACNTCYNWLYEKKNNKMGWSATCKYMDNKNKIEKNRTSWASCYNNNCRFKVNTGNGSLYSIK